MLKLIFRKKLKMMDNKSLKIDEPVSQSEEFNDNENNSLNNCESRLALLELKVDNSILTQEKRNIKIIKLSLMNLGLKSITLCILAVALFLGANRYQDLTLWGIGICLVIFALVEFIDGDGLKNLW